MHEHDTPTAPKHARGQAWRLAIALLGLLTGFPLAQDEAAGDEPAQDAPAPAHEDDEAVVLVTARRVEEDAFHVPRSVTVVDAAALAGRNPLSVLDALDERIGIWVEKRTTTTSDPVLRGLSGANLLALVDGNTLSTFWGEGGFAGDDMYGKVDPDSIERVEVLRGPASVLYGSNALGGVIRFITRSSPIDYTSSGTSFGSRLRQTYGTAANEFRTRAETFGATPEMKYLVGMSVRDIDDVRAGGDVGLQEPTSGREQNYDAKLEWMPNDSSELVVSAQDVHRRGIHRFYRPTQDNENIRQALSISWNLFDPTPYWREARFNLYRQHKQDERRWFNNGDRGKARWETTTADVQFTHQAGAKHTLIYGLGLHRDDSESPDDEQFTITEATGNRYKAAPDTVWDNAGVFVQDTWQVDDRWAVTSGLRWDQFRFESDPDPIYANNPNVTNPALDRFTDRQGALTGGVGLLYELDEQHHLFADYSRGFRQFAPNFGVRQLGFGVLVPNELLDPVTADNFELGMKWREHDWQGAIAAYYTRLHDFQNIVQGTFQGSTFFDIEGDGIEADDRVYVNKGNGEAEVHGIEMETSVQLRRWFPRRFGPEWTLHGGVMWNIGKDRTNDEPLRHTHPARALVRLRWAEPDPERALWWELAADLVRHYDRIPPGRLASDPTYLEDPQDPASGPYRSDGQLPGYTVLDLRGGMRLGPRTTLTAAVENLLDKRYRPAHSRMDAPGINVLLSIDVRF